MGFRNGSYAKVWEVRAGKGNYSEAKISISKKNKQTEQYETDFSGYVRLVGDAHKNGAGLPSGSKIKIGDCDVTNYYDKEKKITYTNFVVFNFTMADGGAVPQQNTQATGNENWMNIPSDIEESLPFN